MSASARCRAPAVDGDASIADGIGGWNTPERARAHPRAVAHGSAVLSAADPVPSCERFPPNRPR